MSAFTANAAVAAAVALTGISLLLAAIGGLSYARLRHGRLLGVTAAFAMMAVQGVTLIVLTHRDRAAIADGELGLFGLVAMNLAIVLALYVAMLKR